jgi:kynurenine formamidase
MLSRRNWLRFLACSAIGCHRSLAGSAPTRPSPARAASGAPQPGFGAFEVVDLSHTLSPASPYIPVRDATFPFRRAPIATIEERGVYANRWELTEHIGTHVDAPCHFERTAPCLEAIALDDLFAEVVLIDLSARAATDPDAELTPDDIQAWDVAHGPMPERSAVLLHTGWDRFWPSQARFANADSSGVMHFPGFSRAAIELLSRRSEVLGIGVDTFSIDPGRDRGFAGHRVLARARKWALECLAHLDRLPARGAHLFVGAPSVEAASGSPARVIAWVPRQRI